MMLPHLLAWAILGLSLALGGVAAEHKGSVGRSLTNAMAHTFRDKCHGGKESSYVLSAAGLTLPPVDAHAYAEEKGELFGYHARNVYHVATQVNLYFPLTGHLHLHSQPTLFCRLLT